MALGWEILFHDTQEFQNAEDDADQIINADQRTQQTEDDADHRNLNLCQQTDQPAYHSANNQKDDQLDNQGNNVFFFHHKAGGPNFLQQIHNRNLLNWW